MRESKRNRSERGLEILIVDPRKRLTREVLGVRSQNDDHPNHTCDAGAKFKMLPVSD